MRKNSIIIIFLAYILSSCSSTKKSHFQWLITNQIPDGTPVKILSTKVKAHQCNSSIGDYSINQAIMHSLEGVPYSAYGLYDVTVTEYIGTFMYSMNRCFSVEGKPIVDRNRKNK